MSRSLVVIAYVTISMALLSMSGLGILIVHRSIANARQRRAAARSKILYSLALEYLEMPDFYKAFQAQLKPGDAALLVKLFCQLLQQVRGEFAEQLVEMMKVLGVVEHALHDIKAASASTRTDACSILGYFPEPRVITALETALDSTEVEVRLEAARSLIRLKAPPSVDRLLKTMAVGRQAHSLAVIDLFRSLGPSAVPELAALLASSPEPQVTLLAVDALGHLSSLEAVPILMRFASDESPEIRATALQALGRLNDPRGESVILKGLRDPVWAVRAQAARIAGQMGSLQMIPALSKRLDDEHWWVRHSAAEALFRLGGQGLIVLWAATNAKEPRTRDIAYGLLRERGLVV